MARSRQRLSPAVDRERRRLALALSLSLLIHTLLLGLTFDGQGLGLPGFGFPWRDRRIEAPELRVVLVPAPVTAAKPVVASTAEPSQAAPIEQRVAVAPPMAEPTAEAVPRANAATDAADAEAPLPVDGPRDAAPPAPIPAPAVIASERSDEAAFIVPPAASASTPVVAAAPGASSPEPVVLARPNAKEEAQERVDREARERAVEVARLDRSEREVQRQAEQLEAARVEAVRLEAERHEAARQAAIRQEAIRQEAARQEGTKAEAARLEAERQEAARQAAARQDAALQEAARQEAARAEAARSENERQEAARLEAAKGEAARLEGERQEATRREAARRAMGRQLDEEADRREAASTATRPPGTLPPSSSGSRRGRLFGRTDANAELVLYAEAWARKIELNLTFDMVREAAKKPHTDPLVTVAIRNDGSVESVTFVRSSGVVEIDEAIVRIVQSQLPYQAFPPGLARQYDVIEIRRTWYFDMAVRLY